MGDSARQSDFFTFREGYDTALKHVVAYMRQNAHESQQMWEGYLGSNPLLAEYWRGSMNDLSIVARTIEGHDSDEFAKWVQDASANDLAGHEEHHDGDV